MRSERLDLLDIVNLQGCEFEAKGRLAVPQKVQCRAVGDDGLDLHLVRPADHAVVEVHAARYGAGRRNLHLESVEADLIEAMGMEDEGGPGANHGHALNGGERRDTRVAMAIEGDVLRDEPGMGEIGAVVALNGNFALECVLQERMYLAKAKRPEEEHEVHADERNRDHRDDGARGDLDLFFFLAGSGGRHRKDFAGYQVEMA